MGCPLCQGGKKTGKRGGRLLKHGGYAKWNSAEKGVLLGVSSYLWVVGGHIVESSGKRGKKRTVGVL